MRRIWKSGEYEEAATAMDKVMSTLKVMRNKKYIHILEYEMAIRNAMDLAMLITDKGTEEVEE